MQLAILLVWLEFKTHTNYFNYSFWVAVQPIKKANGVVFHLINYKKSEW